MFFSNNVPEALRHQISTKFGFSRTQDLGPYLGVPVGQTGTTASRYDYILERPKQRLSNWKGRHLSFDGRLTLAKPVLQALPTYAMQTTPLLVSTCNNLDRICRSFI